MKTSFTDSFAKDLQRIKDRTTRQRVAALITAVEQAPSTEEIVNLSASKEATARTVFASAIIELAS